MARFQARVLAQHDPLHVWGMLPPIHELEFDDGEVITSTNKKTYYSSYFWIFHKEYPGVPLTKAHHVDAVLKGQPLNSSTHIKLLQRVSEDVIAVHQLLLPQQKEHVLSLIYLITNRIHNEVAQKAEDSVVTIDLLDFIEVAGHPQVRMAVDEIPKDVHSKNMIIDRNYDKIMGLVKSHPDFTQNNLARAVRSNVVNANQVKQCIAYRGFPTEVDGKILNEPILSNFVYGNNRLYDYVAESRSAAKSHYFAEAPLEKAEYFSRRLQLLTMVIERIVYRDCGSQRYVEWIVSPPRQDETGKTTYPGDLKFMMGKYYLDPEDGKTLKEIKGDESYLYNKLIRMRSVLYCEEKDPHAICSTCFGAMSQNVSAYVNIGHLCAASMTQQTSQSVLSTKHLDASSRSTDIVLGDLARRYLTTTDSKSAFLIKKEFRDKKVRLIVDREQAAGLSDVMMLDDLRHLSLGRISAIEEIDFRFEQNGKEETITIRMEQEKRKAIFTLEFLYYLKQHRWEIDEKGNFVFDLKDWNFDEPPMMLPDMEYSFSDHSEQIANMIESSMVNITERSKPESPAKTLQELFTKVNDKLNVNIAQLEVILAAVMVPHQGSYGLGRGKPNAVLGVANQLIKNRSLSNAYAFQDQVETILAPKNFYMEGRPDSPFDVFITPFEVLKAVCERIGDAPATAE
jgi:hypothetical protein